MAAAIEGSGGETRPNPCGNMTDGGVSYHDARFGGCDAEAIGGVRDRREDSVARVGKGGATRPHHDLGGREAKGTKGESGSGEGDTLGDDLGVGETTQETGRPNGRSAGEEGTTTLSSPRIGLDERSEEVRITPPLPTILPLRDSV